jgi:hypothetical protein
MPDLSADSVAIWLFAREPAIAADLSTSTASSEEHEIVLPSVLRLGAVLDNTFHRSPDHLNAWLRRASVQADVCVALAQIERGRRLRLLHWLAEIPGSENLTATLLESANSDAASFLRAEIRALHRRALLNSIFGPERIAALLAACTEAAQRETT